MLLNSNRLSTLNKQNISFHQTIQIFHKGQFKPESCGWPSPLHHELLRRCCYSCPPCNIQACCLYLSVNMMRRKIICNEGSTTRQGELPLQRQTSTLPPPHRRPSQPAAVPPKEHFFSDISVKSTHNLLQLAHPHTHPFFPIEATLRARFGTSCASYFFAP